MTSNLVDFHCHLDLYPDFESLLSECEEKCIHTLTVTTTPKAWPRNHALASATKYIRAALGLHPQLVSERAHEINLWSEYLAQTRYVGEVGLDASPRFYKNFDQQKEVFQHVLKKCSQAGDKIITVHSVRSVTKVLDMIEDSLVQDDCKVVLHWFTGNLKEAKRAIDLGCYFSVNKGMANKQQHRQLIEELPLNRILTETDGPFTKCGDIPARPYDVGEVLEDISIIRNINKSLLAKQIVNNLNEIES